MEKILNKSSFRKLSILNLLFYSDSYIEKQQMSDKLGITIKTLNKDIDEINQLYETFSFQIAVYQKNLLYLKKHNDTTINISLISAYMTYHSDIYKIAKLTFSDTPEFVEKIAESESISISNAYLKLEEFDAILAENRLFLGRQPLEILGNEVNIRFFYFHLFERAYLFSGWDFPDIPLEIINTFIEKTTRFLGIYLPPASKIDYAIALGISLTRIKNGHFAQLSKQSLSLINDFSSLYYLAAIDFTILEEGIGLELPDTECYLLLLACFLTPFTFFDNDIMFRMLTYNKKWRPARYNLVNQLVQLIGGKNKNLEALKADLLNYFSKFTFIERTTHIVDIDYFSRTTYPEWLDKNKIQQIIDEASQNKELEFIKDNKAVILTYLYEFINVATLSKTIYSPIKIKVLSKKGHLWEQFMKYEIRKCFPKELVDFSEDLYSYEHLEEYDIIISDYPLILSNTVETLLWNMPPTKGDLDRLKSIVDNF